MRGGSTKINRRRKRKYNLHYRCRKKGLQVNIKQLTIYVKTEQIPLCKQAENLKNEFRYEVQIKLF